MFDSAGKATRKIMPYTQEQAMNFLKSNEAYLKEAGLYEKIANALGM